MYVKNRQCENFCMYKPQKVILPMKMYIEIDIYVNLFRVASSILVENNLLNGISLLLNMQNSYIFSISYF